MNKKIFNHDYLSFFGRRLVFNSERPKIPSQPESLAKKDVSPKKTTLEQANEKAIKAIRDAEVTISRLLESGNPNLIKLAKQLQKDMDRVRKNISKPKPKKKSTPLTDLEKRLFSPGEGRPPPPKPSKEKRSVRPKKFR